MTMLSMSKEGVDGVERFLRRKGVRVGVPGRVREGEVGQL